MVAAAAFARDGYVVLGVDARVAAWAAAAHAVVGRRAVTDLRHGGTWSVGVDALPNAADGSIAGVPLRGPWEALLPRPAAWHRAQVSIVYPGYPRRDPDESLAAHSYRLRRDAAHVDGLLPEGPERRRFLREPHEFVLGLPLNAVAAAPLVVWPGSVAVMRAAFAQAFAGIAPQDWAQVDVTEAYQQARKQVFATCPRVEVAMQPGQAVVVHRHLLHGVAPWGAAPPVTEGRMVAYFRPMFPDPAAWLA